VPPPGPPAAGDSDDTINCNRPALNDRPKYACVAIPLTSIVNTISAPAGTNAPNVTLGT
jgi:hypothetical protein